MSRAGRWGHYLIGRLAGANRYRKRSTDSAISGSLRKSESGQCRHFGAVYAQSARLKAGQRLYRILRGTPFHSPGIAPDATLRCSAVQFSRAAPLFKVCLIKGRMKHPLCTRLIVTLSGLFSALGVGPVVVVQIQKIE
ncbi:hypothetical protein HMPREF1487_08905 [Pseudomonas sp. HPB0071]|uniref:Uncharacterized protein n=1 Tax=Pseudomonas luteola TaxID=47886 RepID=A0A2X2DW77_PSELU|nr:hypothetical protein HMPREF1487_08905 [Pseudomonas sp. HPB0071]SHJ02879.1 hypothetical protein SAMN05216295_106171 [Pseudomonas zeshuii]SPZ16335.1 Uncharacterised protein [Pseudomonas luteola]